MTKLPTSVSILNCLCSNGHKVKGVAEGKAKPCEDCGQTLDEKTGDISHPWVERSVQGH